MKPYLPALMLEQFSVSRICDFLSPCSFKSGEKMVSGFRVVSREGGEEKLRRR